MFPLPSPETSELVSEALRPKVAELLHACPSVRTLEFYSLGCMEISPKFVVAFLFWRAFPLATRM
jgi:hypothetical protein